MAAAGKKGGSVFQEESRERNNVEQLLTDFRLDGAEGLIHRLCACMRLHES